MGQQRVRAIVSACAIGYGLLGVLLLFAPDEVANLLGFTVAERLVTQLLGGALLGYAAMNWIARGTALGGIYGRAVVAGNQAHLAVGAILLVQQGLAVGSAHPAYWTLTVLYVAGAVFFSYLTFFSSGPIRG